MNKKKSFDIVFAGTPAFAATTLAALLDSSHKIKAVYTQPDRPAGRGQKLTSSPIKQLALQHQIPVYQPVTLQDVHEQKILKEMNADIMIVVAYGLILPKTVLTMPRLGCVNIHASLLPRWRGAAPIQRAILAGDSKTGVTIMQMDEGLDTGAMLYQLECPIDSHATSEILHDRLATLGAKAIIEALEKLDNMVGVPQQGTATYAHKISKQEAKINWNLSAEEIDRQIRAFNPWPVAFTVSDDQTIRVWEAEVINHEKPALPPGTMINVSAQGIDVATGKGVLRLTKIQLSGGKVLASSEVLNARQGLFTKGNILKNERN